MNLAKAYVFAPFLAMVLSLAPVTATAETLVLEYYTNLSPADTYSSKGVPLTDVCAIVQQDRANVHRFGNPDGEQPDSVFTDQERRAMILGKCDYSQSHHTVERIRSEEVGFVLVRVFGAEGAITRVQILEAAG